MTRWLAVLVPVAVCVAAPTQAQDLGAENERLKEKLGHLERELAALRDLAEVRQQRVKQLEAEVRKLKAELRRPKQVSEAELKGRELPRARGRLGPKARPKGRHRWSPSARPSAPIAYANRIDKVSLVRLGGSQKTQRAAEAGLKWLATHQSPDGRWDSDGWTRNCTDGKCTGQGNSLGDGRYDVGVSGLALLAFLADGQTHHQGEYKTTVENGLLWLIDQQKPDGSLGFGHGETIYNTALATLAICEAYALSGDPTLKAPAQAAVRFCVLSQNPGLGWKYGVKSGRNDTSVTAWMVQALKAAKAANLDVPDDAFAGARRWFTRVTDSRGSAGYETPGGGSAFLAQNDGKYDVVPVMTAASIWCRILMGERRSEDGVRKGTRLLASSLPDGSGRRPRRASSYYWYYGTYALAEVGGEKWHVWNAALQKALLPHQAGPGGCGEGGWPPVGEWSLAGGKVYTTAMNALVLEVYYRFR